MHDLVALLGPTRTTCPGFRAEARERDLRRDTALAALGWVVLGFSYRRLMQEPETCRTEILSAYRLRRSVVP